MRYFTTQSASKKNNSKNNSKTKFVSPLFISFLTLASLGISANGFALSINNVGVNTLLVNNSDTNAQSPTAIITACIKTSENEEYNAADSHITLSSADHEKEVTAAPCSSEQLAWAKFMNPNTCLSTASDSQPHLLCYASNNASGLESNQDYLYSVSANATINSSKQYNHSSSSSTNTNTNTNMTKYHKGQFTTIDSNLPFISAGSQADSVTAITSASTHRFFRTRFPHTSQRQLQLSWTVDQLETQPSAQPVTASVRLCKDIQQCNQQSPSPAPGPAPGPDITATCKADTCQINTPIDSENQIAKITTTIGHTSEQEQISIPQTNGKLVTPIPVLAFTRIITATSIHNNTPDKPTSATMPSILLGGCLEHSTPVATQSATLDTDQQMVNCPAALQHKITTSCTLAAQADNDNDLFTPFCFSSHSLSSANSRHPFDLSAQATIGDNNRISIHNDGSLRSLDAHLPIVTSSYAQYSDDLTILPPEVVPPEGYLDYRIAWTQPNPNDPAQLSQNLQQCPNPISNPADCVTGDTTNCDPQTQLCNATIEHRTPNKPYIIQLTTQDDKDDQQNYTITSSQQMHTLTYTFAGSQLLGENPVPGTPSMCKYQVGLNITAQGASAVNFNLATCGAAMQQHAQIPTSCIKLNTPGNAYNQLQLCNITAQCNVDPSIACALSSNFNNSIQATLKCDDIKDGGACSEQSHTIG